MNSNLIAMLVCAGCCLVLEMEGSELAVVPFALAALNFMLYMI